MPATDIQQLSDAFRAYLMGKLDGREGEVSAVMECAEGEMAEVLNEYFGAGLSSIYDLTDCGAIEDYRKKIRTTPVLKNQDMHREPRYTEVLKWYLRFRRSLNDGVAPFPVPGETDGQGAAADESPATTLTTVYLEGEALETLSEEHRRRNAELRRACIRHFRSLHGGRIVCECCGFDFSRAYDIEDEYIEVHHRFPFAQTDGAHEVNAVTDLVPLCANCHRMIHHGQGGRGSCMTLEELKERYRGIKYS